LSADGGVKFIPGRTCERRHDLDKLNGRPCERSLVGLGKGARARAHYFAVYLAAGERVRAANVVSVSDGVRSLSTRIQTLTSGTGLRR